VAEIVGRNVNETLVATTGDDLIDGGGGTDVVSETLGDDVYNFSILQDSLTIQGGGGGNDMIELANPFLDAESARFDYAGVSGLAISFPTFGRNIQIDIQFGALSGVIETLEYNDGILQSFAPSALNELLLFRGRNAAVVAADDEFKSGRGNDFFVIEPTSREQIRTVFGFDGNDVYLVERGAGLVEIVDAFDDNPLSQRTIQNTLILEVLATDVVEVIEVRGGLFVANRTTGDEIEVSITGEAISVFLASPAGNVYVSSVGEDVLIGGAGDDRYGVNNPNDIVFEEADGGFDRIDILADQDLFRTPEFVELVVIGPGVSATIVPATTGTSIAGREGNDVFFAGPGTDFYDGNDGTDTLTYENSPAGVSASLLKPTAFNTGGAGTDKIDDIENLIGSSFDDVLVGAQGISNVIDGGPGNDLIVGFAGPDRISGGSGNDIFAYNRVNFRDSLSGGGEDQIQDFVKGEDLLDLSRLGDADDLDILFQPGRIEVDTDGDGTREFAINFANSVLLGIDDLVLT